MWILVGAWTVLCGLLLTVNLLGHGPAEIPHLLRHAADYGILCALGLAAIGATVLALRYVNRPLPMGQLLGPPDAHGDPVLRIGGMRLTQDRVYGPMGRSVTWSDVASVDVHWANLVPFLAVLGTKCGRHRAGFMQPLLPGRTKETLRLFRYYLANPQERKWIGTRDGIERAARLGLLNVSDLQPADPLAGAEGESIADATLRTDVWSILLLADRLASGTAGESCDNRRVVQVEVLAAPEIDEADTLQGPWRERWTIDRCGVEAGYVVRFRAAPEGGVNFKIEGSIALPDA